MLGDWTYHPAHDNPSIQHPNDGQIAIAARPTANVSLPFRDPTGSSSLGREKELLQASGRIGGQVGDFRPSCVSCVCHFSNHSQNPKLVSCATAKSFFAPVGALRLRILGGTGRVLPLVFAALLHCTRSGCCGLRFRLDTGAAVLVHRRLSMSNPLHHDREPRCKRTTSPEPPRTRRRTNLRLACDGCLPLPAHGRHGGLLIETFPLQTPASPIPISSASRTEPSMTAREATTHREFLNLPHHAACMGFPWLVTQRLKLPERARQAHPPQASHHSLRTGSLTWALSKRYATSLPLGEPAVLSNRPDAMMETFLVEWRLLINGPSPRRRGRQAPPSPPM